MVKSLFKFLKKHLKVSKGDRQSSDSEHRYGYGKKSSRL
jgi:hypothetical protein